MSNNKLNSFNINSTQSTKQRPKMVKIQALRKLLKNKYTDIERIGAGASGIVCKGKNISTGNIEAIKCIVLPDEDTQSPDKEINILNSCNHPNIVRIYNSFTLSNDSIDVLFITMELCEEDLQELLSKKMGNPLRDIEYRKIFRELVAGVKYLHENKIVHRDLKPHNIFLHHGVTKIGDFGIAKILNTQVLIGTKSKYINGSPNYMAPERLNYSAPSGKVDVWSLGCILYELIEGKLAFPGVDLDEVLPKLIQCKCPKSVKAKQPELDIIRRTIAPEAKRMDINELFNLTNTGITIEYTGGFIELQDMGAHEQEEYKFAPIKIQPIHHFKPIAPLFTYKKKNEIKYSKCVVHKKLVLYIYIMY